MATDINLQNSNQYNISEKDKTTALILSIFLGFWTWLYTYKKDSFKFWISLFFSGVTFGIFWFIAWIWAIVETVNRPKEFYENFSQYLFTMSNQIANTDFGVVRNYKLNILLFEISKRKRNIKIFSSKIHGYIAKILYVFFIFLIGIGVPSLILESGIIITDWTHYAVSDGMGERHYALTDDGIGAIFLIALIGVILSLFLIKRKTPKFIERIHNKNVELYEFHLKELDKSFPKIISDFGGMEMFKKLFK